MSVVRFVHSDALRLGSPISGLGGCPDWLRKIAASAVRTAVTNAFEAAIAARCHLFLIAGRICESTQDLDLAAGWLRTQTSQLREHGIQLVIAGHHDDDSAILSGLDAIRLGPGQRLDVSCDARDRPDVRISPAAIPAKPGTLGIEIAPGAIVRPHADLAYVAVPALCASQSTNSTDGTTRAHDRLLRLSAGCPQAIQPSEQGAFGCQLVEADLIRQSLIARFCPTDLIRYCQMLLNCDTGMSLHQICELIRERSRTIASTGRCTTVVEWLVDGRIHWPTAETHAFTEYELLEELRNSLNAGHSGAWPGRIRFTEGATMDVGCGSHTASGELVAVIRERLQRSHSPEAQIRAGVPLGAGSEVLTGISLLRRVA